MESVANSLMIVILDSGCLFTGGAYNSTITNYDIIGGQNLKQSSLVNA